MQTELMVTDLSHNLNDQELNLLAKGPKFGLLDGVDNNTIDDFQASFYRLANSLRWREYHERTQATQQTTIETYPKSNYIRRPESSTELEQTLKRIHNDYQRIVKSIQPKPKWTNLNSAEKHTIKALRKKDNIYLPSDKGGEFCVIDLQTYNEAALQHLEDPHTYRKIPRMSAKTVEGKINPVWKDICVRRNIPKFVKRSYVSNNTELPRFYHLVKTHKLEQGIKIRPIVSNSNALPHDSHGYSREFSNHNLRIFLHTWKIVCS